MIFPEPYSTKNKVGLLLGPALFFSLFLLPTTDTFTPDARFIAGMALLMACWWITEALPISVTALLPLILVPVFTELSLFAMFESYTNHLIFLFLGGFLIAASIQHWELHKRIALQIVNRVGNSADKIILGFMLSCALLSMWVSNTATAMMMLPIGLAIISQFSQSKSAQESGFSQALMLGIAYACSIGGIATLIGTPPNAILAGVADKQLNISINFLDWFLFAFPISCIFLFISWLYLTRFCFKLNKLHFQNTRDTIQSEISNLGPMSTPEKRILLIFLLTALAWVINGLFDIPILKTLKDSGIAMLAACSLFLIPSGHQKDKLLNFRRATKVPWDILILFGGGFALATSFSESGLTTWLANQLELLQYLNPIILIAALTLLVIFLTEITSNTATATIFLPLMASLAIAIDTPPLLLMIPVAIAASYAFMLPVATPPNAIVFSSRQISIPTMAKSGFILNIIACVLIVVSVVYYSPLIWA